MIHTGTVKQTFLKQCAQSRLKSACALFVETWMVLIPICRVPSYVRGKPEIEETIIYGKLQT
jgi:hypothetical protein